MREYSDAKLKIIDRKYAMEYFGRLGLVFRKNKERGVGTSSCQVAAESKETRCAVEPWGDTGHLKSAAINESSSLTASETERTQGLVEFRSTSSPREKDAAVLTHSFPKQDTFVDLEYLEYEKQVQARARALKNGARSGWTALVFWKRHHDHRPGMKKPAFMSSGASTPLPQSCAAAARRRRRGSCATVGPLYRNESPTTLQQLSHRAWKDDCNLSPYAALTSDRRRSAVSPGPLYLV